MHEDKWLFETALTTIMLCPNALWSVGVVKDSRNIMHEIYSGCCDLAREYASRDKTIKQLADGCSFNDHILTITAVPATTHRTSARFRTHLSRLINAYSDNTEMTKELALMMFWLQRVANRPLGMLPSMLWNGVRDSTHTGTILISDMALWLEMLPAPKVLMVESYKESHNTRRMCASLYVGMTDDTAALMRMVVSRALTVLDLSVTDVPETTYVASSGLMSTDMPDVRLVEMNYQNVPYPKMWGDIAAYAAALDPKAPDVVPGKDGMPEKYGIRHYLDAAEGTGIPARDLLQEYLQRYGVIDGPGLAD